MHQGQQKLRHTAAEEFMQSLDELQDILQKRQSPTEQAFQSEPKQTPASELPLNSLQALEQAAADIEEFFQQTQT